jgi:hypothetical protein
MRRHHGGDAEIPESEYEKYLIFMEISATRVPSRIRYEINTRERNHSLK